MVAYQAEEGLPADQRGLGDGQGLTIAPRVAGLFDEDQQPRVVAGRFAIDLLAAAADDDADLFDVGGDDLFKDEILRAVFSTPSRLTKRCSGRRSWFGPVRR